MNATILRILLAVTSVGVSAHAADWPRFRGVNGDGISPETGLSIDWKARPPKELWRVKLGDNGFAGPSIADGKLYIIDHVSDDDIVRAIDVKTGKDVWTHKYSSPYIPEDPSWGRGRSTPTFHEGKLYTIGTQGTLICFEAATGKILWSKELVKDFGGKRPQWAYAAGPIIDGDRMLVTPWGGANADLAVLELATGKLLFKGGTGGKAGYSPPVIATIDGVKQYALYSGNELAGMDASDGRVLWKINWVNQFQMNAAVPVVLEKGLFITSAGGKGGGLVTVDKGTASFAWTTKEIKSSFNAPVLLNGFLYGIGEPGSLTCVDVKDGTEKWHQNGFESGGLISADGVLFAIAGGTGEVVAVKADPTSYQELGRITPIKGRSWAPPILADGKLYVRDQQELVCLDLK